MQIVTTLPKPNGGTAFFKVPDDSELDFNVQPGWLRIRTGKDTLFFNLVYVAAIVPDFDFPRRKDHEQT